MTRSAIPLLLVLLAAPARAGIPADDEEGDCLGCDSDPDQSLTLPSGEKLGLYVDRDVFAKSVHGEALRCTECHSDKTAITPPARFPSRPAGT